MKFPTIHVERYRRLWPVALLVVVLLAVTSLWWARLSDLWPERGRDQSGDYREQTEKIRPIRPAQMPRIASQALLIKFLWRSFSDWRPLADPRGRTNVAALIVARDQARERLANEGKQADFDALVAATVNYGQLLWAMQHALTEVDTRFLDARASHEILQRMREVTGQAVGTSLHVEVTAVLRAVSIPDASKDEIRLDLIVNSGAPADALVAYMVANKMVDAHDAPALAARWTQADALIGATEEERQNLAKCLGVTPADAVDQQELLVFYNYGPNSKFIWRDAMITVTYPAHLNTARYPFDTTLFNVVFAPISPLDSSKLTLAPFGISSPPLLDLRLSRPPRGFYFLRQTANLTPISMQDNSNSMPRPALLYVFQMARRLDTAIWRTFIPLLLIVGFGLVASLRALATHENLGTIMTSLLPSLTVACVALQLTASSMIPAHSGGTVMDKIFVCMYVHILFLFLALNTHHLRRVSWVMLGCSLTAFAYGLHFFF